MDDINEYHVVALDQACPRCGQKPVEISNNCYCKQCWFPIIQQTCKCGDEQSTYGHSLPNGDVFRVCATCGSRWVDRNLS